MQAEDRIGWEIHYTDLSVYTQASGLWGDAPTSGVLIVVECGEKYKEVYMGMDYYYMDPMPSGNVGSYLEADKDDYSFLPASGVKIGNWIDQSTWNTVHENIFGV